MAIAACFALQREICSSVLLAFFDSIGQTQKNSVQVNVFWVTPESGRCSIRLALRMGVPQTEI
jgi:hypothetical protein